MVEYRKVALKEASKVYSFYCNYNGVMINLLEGKKALKTYDVMTKNGSFYFGAFDDDRLIGIISVNNIMTLSTSGIHLFLEDAIVLEEFQGKGIMRDIVSNVLKLYEKYPSIYVSTNCKVIKHLLKEYDFVKYKHN